MENYLLSWFKLDPGEGAFYAVFGLLFVFLGIVLLIAIFTLIGFLMKKVNGRSKAHAANPPQPAIRIDEGIPPEVVAAITAAIAVYTEGERSKCDFVVRRIRKI